MSVTRIVIPFTYKRKDLHEESGADRWEGRKQRYLCKYRQNGGTFEFTRHIRAVSEEAALDMAKKLLPFQSTSNVHKSWWYLLSVTEHPYPPGEEPAGTIGGP